MIGEEDFEPIVSIKGRDGDHERLLGFLLVDNRPRIRGRAAANNKNDSDDDCDDDDGSTTTSGTGTSDDTVSGCASEWVDDDLDLDVSSTFSANAIPDRPSDTAGTVALTDRMDLDGAQEDSDPGTPSNAAVIIAEGEVANNATESFFKKTSRASRISGFPDTDDVDADPPSVSTEKRVGFLESTVGFGFGDFHGAPSNLFASDTRTWSRPGCQSSEAGGDEDTFQETKDPS